MTKIGGDNGSTSDFFPGSFPCARTVEEIMEREWNDSEEWERQKRLEMEKGAIMGHEKETCFYKTKIQNILKGLIPGVLI